MKIKSLLQMLFGLMLTASIAASAEETKLIYKWKDAQGAMRYTDMPPPYGTKNVVTIRKNSASKAVETTAAPTDKPNASVSQTVQKAEDTSPEAMAKKRRDLEEAEKASKDAKADEIKRKQLNCAAAKSNYQAYNQGTRVVKVNEKGEREYLNDKSIKEGAIQAQKDIKDNCS